MIHIKIFRLYKVINLQNECFGSNSMDPVYSVEREVNQQMLDIKNEQK